jgi:hypothetical protein
MYNCFEMNFTSENAYYARKIYSEDKTWAWWLNNLGKKKREIFLLNQLISIIDYFLFSRYISCFCHWFLW